MFCFSFLQITYSIKIQSMLQFQSRKGLNTDRLLAPDANPVEEEKQGLQPTNPERD